MFACKTCLPSTVRELVGDDMGKRGLLEAPRGFRAFNLVTRAVRCVYFEFDENAPPG